jgi:hypothetical protein
VLAALAPRNAADAAMPSAIAHIGFLPRRSNIRCANSNAPCASPPGLSHTCSTLCTSGLSIACSMRAARSL